MDTHKFFVEKMRFHLKEQDTLVFVGWFFDGSTKEHSIKAYLDNRELPLTVQVNRGAEVRQKYIRSINEIEEEVVGIIKLPPDWRNGRRVTLMAAYREEYKKSYAISTAKLGRLENEVSYYVENCHREGSQITVTGWGISSLNFSTAADSRFPRRWSTITARIFFLFFRNVIRRRSPVFWCREPQREGRADRFIWRCVARRIIREPDSRSGTRARSCSM